MGILQDTYPEKQPIGYPGMPATSEEKNDITRSSETVAGIAFGVPAARGAGELSCITAATVNDKILGITLRDPSRPPKDGDKYAKGANVTIRTKGSVWVVPGVVVAAGDPVFFDFATGKYTNLTNGGANLTMTGWVFDTASLANGLSIAVRR